MAEVPGLEEKDIEILLNDGGDIQAPIKLAPKRSLR